MYGFHEEVIRRWNSSQKVLVDPNKIAGKIIQHVNEGNINKKFYKEVKHRMENSRKSRRNLYRASCSA